MMRIRLTRKLADFIDGVDLRSYNVGDVIDLPSSNAKLLLAEGWASQPSPSRADRSATPSKRNSPREERQIRDSVQRERVRATEYDVPPSDERDGSI
jgi:hypothetical protein